MAQQKVNGWNEWSRHVLTELERLNNYCETIDDKLDGLVVDVAMLKVKAGLWGAMAGLIPSALAVIYLLIEK